MFGPTFLNPDVVDNADWIDTNPDNGGTYYGYDNGDGTTRWMDEDGNLDCITETPDGEDDYTQRVDK